MTKASPIFWERDDVRRPISLLPAGTQVRVLGQEGSWYRISFHDVQLGDQTAYISPFDVTLVPSDSPEPSNLSAGDQFSQRGFIEGRIEAFPQKAPNDSTTTITDGVIREEFFAKPSRWLGFAAGLDLRANADQQVENQWRLDLDDRGVKRPQAAVRRLSLAMTTSHFTLDVGKQFIRWGRADILSPTDRFAPRDYLNVINTEFLPVWGVRPSIQVAGETFEGVWLPHATPSRLPLLNRRWSVIPPEATGFTLVDRGSIFPTGSQSGFRWNHRGRYELGLSYFDGFNHLADISTDVNLARRILGLTRTYPRLRTYGAELSAPLPWLTVKSESAYFTSPSSQGDEYMLYVVEAERQVGEWLFDGGYAGEVVTRDRGEMTFSPERGLARSVIGRASYTVDPTRTVTVEAAVRQNMRGVYAKGEYTQAFRQHWRVTLAAIGIGGSSDDFLGQYNRNSHGSLTLRLSF